MHNERVIAHSLAWTLNLADHIAGFFYLLLCCTKSLSCACHILQKCESLNRLNTLLVQNRFCIFSAIAARVRFSHLEVLTLDGIRCAGQDLHRFLLSHTGLQNLTIENFDVVGTTSYASILEMLSKTHDNLRYFTASQVAQNAYRLYLKTIADIEVSPYRYSFSDAPPDFFDDFLTVSMPSKYHWTAEEWEGVQQKLVLMADDMAVSTKNYHPEYELSHYTWSH